MKEKTKSILAMAILCVYFMSADRVYAVDAGASDGDLFKREKAHPCQLAQQGIWREFALRTCKKRATEGDSFAQFILGNIYYYGRIVQSDFVKSLEYYRQAANNRKINALVRLGGMYKSGDVLKKNYEKAYIVYSAVKVLGYPKLAKSMNRLERRFETEEQKERAEEGVGAMLARIRANEPLINWEFEIIDGLILNE